MTWDVDTYAAEVEHIYSVDPAVDAGVDYDEMTADEIQDAIWKKSLADYAEKRGVCRR